MTCLAPGLVYSKPNQPEGALRPDEFGFIFDQVTQIVIQQEKVDKGSVASSVNFFLKVLSY